MTILLLVVIASILINAVFIARAQISREKLVGRHLENLKRRMDYERSILMGALRYATKLNLAESKVSTDIEDLCREIEGRLNLGENPNSDV